MGKSSRDKGARVEREIAAYLTDRLGVIVERNLGAARQSQDDITVGKFSIECKARKSFAVSEFMRQAESNADGKIPVVVLREDGDKEPMALMRLKDLAPLIQGEL